MKPKLLCRIILDFMMFAAMPILMAYMLVGEAAHEWIGMGMFLLFLLHHLLNWQWVKNLFHGTYSIARIVKTLCDILIFLLMLGLLYSGVTLSRYIFQDMSFYRKDALARTLHLFCSYWGFVCMSLHLGFHWDLFLGIAKKHLNQKWIWILARGIAAVVFFYGIYAFQKRKIGLYLSMKMHFAFYDTTEPVIRFLLDYIAVAGLFVIIGYFIIKLLKQIQKKGRVKSS